MDRKSCQETKVKPNINPNYSPVKGAGFMNIKNISNSKCKSTADIPQGQQENNVIVGFSMETMRDGQAKPCVHLQHGKPMILNQTNLGAIGKVLGEETDNWVGGIITIMTLPTHFQG